MSREKVLSLLRERQGDYLSGEAMSRELGISRAGVWKAIEGLRQEGYTISSAPNRGYRLEAGPDRPAGGGDCPAPVRLSGGRQPAVPGCHRLHQHRVQASGYGRRGEGLVVTAEEQTGGRGRRGRFFPVAPGEGAVSLRLAAAPGWRPRPGG